MRRFQTVPTNYVLSKNKKNIKIFQLSENFFIFEVQKYIRLLHGQVFVMLLKHDILFQTHFHNEACFLTVRINISTYSHGKKQTNKRKEEMRQVGKKEKLAKIEKTERKKTSQR